jgi:hypothetical protein
MLSGFDLRSKRKWIGFKGSIAEFMRFQFIKKLRSNLFFKHSF